MIYASAMLPITLLRYRCTNTNMAQGAGTCAKMMFDIHALNGNLKYGLLGAIKSILGSRGTPLTPDAMDKLLSRILEGKREEFLCSQFAVYVYQFVAEQLAISCQGCLLL